MERERTGPSAAAATSSVAASVGEMLADRRRALGLSVEDVALKLKFRVRQIEALERGRFERLSGPTFVRGMVRAYARLVGLEPDPLIERMAACFAMPEDRLSALAMRRPIPFSDGAKRANLPYAILSVAVLGVIAAVAWEWHDERAGRNRLTFVRAAQIPLEPARAPVEITATAPIAAELPAVAQERDRPADAAAPEASDGTRRLTLRFDGDSWVEIRARGGGIVLSRLNSAGTERVIEGRPPFNLVIGNAQQVRLRYDDRPIDLAPHLKSDVARLRLE